MFTEQNTITVQRKILMVENFDGYYMENILMDGHCFLPRARKRRNPLKFDGLKFDGLAGKCQKCQNFPHQNLVLYGMYVCASSITVSL